MFNAVVFAVNCDLLKVNIFMIFAKFHFREIHRRMSSGQLWGQYIFDREYMYETFARTLHDICKKKCPNFTRQLPE